MRKHLLSFFLLVISLVCRAHDGENFVASDLFASLQPGDKAALLMVHFGTTHDDTRALTIDAINQKAKEAFKDVELREAWTSRIVMRRLKARGVEKLNPIEALEKLKTDGYTHVFIGNPLLYTPEDYEAVIAAIIKNGAKEGATLLVGHGTYTPATAQYAMLDYMLKEKGFKDYSVGTIEGYPTFDTMVAQVKANGTKKVLLMPFMFVAGDHAKNDIAGEWKEMLEKEGFTVSAQLEGLGQIPEIQEIFIDHIRFGLKHRMLDIMTKKAAYAAGKDTE